MLQTNPSTLKHSYTTRESHWFSLVSRVAQTVRFFSKITEKKYFVGKGFIMHLEEERKFQAILK